MEKAKKAAKKTAAKFKKDNENGARRKVMEEMFYDFNRSRVQVYKMNFFRGIFFGLGSVLGGTVVIAIIAWVLSLFVDFPGIGQSVQNALDTLESQQN